MLNTINSFFSELTLASIGARILLSILCSGILGWERTRKGRPAGSRTYILVSLGASLISMLGIYTMQTYGGADTSRLSAQVISGIGFIGAGAIMSNHYHQVTGITTAAGLWVSACIGLSIGMGFVTGAVLVCFSILLVLLIFKLIERITFNRSKVIQIYIVIDPEMTLHKFFVKLKKIKDYKVLNVESFAGNKKNGIGLALKFHVKDVKERCDVLQKIKDLEGIEYLEIQR